MAYESQPEGSLYDRMASEQLRAEASTVSWDGLIPFIRASDRRRVTDEWPVQKRRCGPRGRRRALPWAVRQASEPHIGHGRTTRAMVGGRTVIQDRTLRCPLEVLTRICVLLSRPDLKNLGLVSHLWAAAARPLLFQTVFLRINVQSFERLHEIARHNTLRQYVRKISYDGRTLDGRAARQGFQDWLRCSAGAGLGLVYEAQRELLSRIDGQELETCYINYLEYLFGQEYIQRRNNAKEMLVQALPKLPGLAALQYVVPHRRDIGMSSTAPPLNALSPQARAILAQPEDYHGYRESDGHFWTLLQSACLSGHAQQLRAVQGSHLDLKRWSAAAAAPLSDCYEALPALRHLSLEFDLAQHSDGDSTTLARVILGATCLESLRLSFEEFSWDDPCAVIHLPQILPPTIQWDHLRRLSLQAVVTTEACLQGLLERHAPSLRSLELSNINLEAAAAPNQDKHGSWIHIIHFLSEILSLEQVRFNGCFSNSWDEGWITRDAEKKRRFGGPPGLIPYPDDCLKYRIERFITHGGVSPFAARKGRGADRLYDYCNLPWIFEEDDSWMFEPRLLQ